MNSKKDTLKAYWKKVDANLFPILVGLALGAILMFGVVIPFIESKLSPLPKYVDVSKLPPPTNQFTLKVWERVIQMKVDVWESYFDITSDCKTMYFAPQPTSDNDNIIGIMDLDTEQVQYVSLKPYLPKGTLYWPQLSPDETQIAWLFTYQVNNPDQDHNDRGVVLMDVKPALGIPRFIYGDTPGSDIWGDFRWSLEGNSIAINDFFDDKSNHEDEYAEVRLSDRKLTMINQDMFEALFLPHRDFITSYEMDEPDHYVTIKQEGVCIPAT